MAVYQCIALENRIIKCMRYNNHLCFSYESEENVRFERSSLLLQYTIPSYFFDICSNDTYVTIFAMYIQETKIKIKVTRLFSIGRTASITNM